GWRQMAMAAMVAAAVFGPVFLVATGGGDTNDDTGLPEEWALAIEQSRADETGLGVGLRNGMRGGTIRVDKSGINAGFIQPNSVVDLKGLIGGKDSSQPILQKALVLATDTVVRRDPPDPKETITENITIAVTPEEAQLLSLARQKGNLEVGFV